MNSRAHDMFGTHRTYKAYTLAVTTWLVSAAEECGYNASSQKTATPPGPPRLKGKARKLARDAAFSAAVPSTKKTQVSCKDLLICADIVSKHKTPTIKMPLEVLAFAKRAIKLRSKCAGWFQDLARSGAETGRFAQDNEGHSHFIAVLEQALEILRPCYNTHTDPATTKESVSDLGNRFSSLQMGELPDQDGDDMSQAFDTAKYTARRVVYEIDTSEEDIYFGIFCLFEDLAGLRQELCEAWVDYRESRCELVSASVATDAAIEFAERLQRNLTDLYPSLETWHSIVAKLFAVLLGRSEIVSPISVLLDGDHVTVPTVFYEWIMAPAHQVTASICGMRAEEFQKHTMETASDEETRRRETKPKGWSRPGASQIEEDMHLVTTFAIEVESARLKPSLLPAEDRITQEWRRRAGPTDLPSLMLVFATQVYLDIASVLGEELNGGLDELDEMKETVERDVQSIQPCDMKKYMPHITPFSDLAHFILTDALDEHKTARQRRTVQRPSQDVLSDRRTRCRLLSQHPTLCGLLILKYKLVVQDIALKKTNQQDIFAILGTAHLYNAARKTNSCQEWPDMEEVIKHTSEEGIFVGQRPDNLTGFARRWNMSIGLSPRAFSKENKARIAANAAIQSAVFRRKDFTGRRRQIMSPNRLSRTIWSDWPHGTQISTLKSETLDSLSDFTIRTLMEKWNLQADSRPLFRCLFLTMPRDFVLAVRVAFYVQEIPSLEFDYLWFDLLCQGILEQLYKTISYETDVPDGGEGCYRVVNSIFLAEGAYYESLGLEADEQHPSGPPMEYVGRVLDQVISSSGAVHSENLVHVEEATCPCISCNSKHPHPPQEPLQPPRGQPAVPHGIIARMSDDAVPEALEGFIKWRRPELLEEVKKELARAEVALRDFV